MTLYMFRANLHRLPAAALSLVLSGATLAAPQPAQEPPTAPAEAPLPEAVSSRRVTSLREALSLAARQGPDVAQARATAALAQVSVERAWGAWRPDLSATGTFDHTSAPARLDFVQFGRGLSAFTNLIIDPARAGAVPPVNITDTNSEYGTLQLSQPLFSPQGLFLLGPARRGAEAASLGADEAREQTLLGVARSYLAVKGLYGLLDAARDAEKVALRREEDARARIAAGTAVEVDLLRAANDTAQARVNIATLDGQIRSLLPLLEALTGEPIAPDRSAEIDPKLGPPSDLEGSPWEQSYGVRSAVHQVKAVQGTLTYDSFSWLPTIAGIAKGNYNSNAGFSGKHSSYDLIIAASVPLYDRGARYVAKHEDEAKLQGALAGLAATRARARATWEGARANLAAASAVLAQSEAQLQLASRAQAQIDASARAGVATSLDLSDADSRKFTAASAVAQARSALEIRRAEVAAAEGRLYRSLGE